MPACAHVSWPVNQTLISDLITCIAPWRQPLQNRPSEHLGAWATPWSAEEMLDGLQQRVDIPAHARSAYQGLLQKRLEEDLCWIVPHVLIGQGTEMNWLHKFPMLCRQLTTHMWRVCKEKKVLCYSGWSRGCMWRETGVLCRNLLLFFFYRGVHVTWSRGCIRKGNGRYAFWQNLPS